ncbi:GNAT family N-acetyltransferase [Bradyrhizobium uaiense]|uniref:GNAT family N-acetyltransferase n=1 Tax=Bradyrhizobium uaiense TaxID=2594946 RepID=A0A6P1BJD1_9BRAD|nr:GNAT family N-acetyltransferase [Bradyrhizobium uaiense]NEU98274.1 GNAT family N-acetyltransferase [Bradyrhizobium uaiense]
MAPAPDEFRVLLDNHLAFLASHRGTVEMVEGNAVVTSEAPGFSTVFATGRPLTPTMIGGRSVRTVPWNDAWASLIPSLELTPSAEMIFMVRNLQAPRPQKLTPSHFSVRRVQTADDIAVFADVQARGFLGPVHPEFAWWHAFMSRKAQENQSNPLQRFLLAYDGSDPVGTLISIYSDSLIGLYAIATLPEHRRLGVCTTLVRVSEADAIGREISTATLQVMAGSIAETVYRDLGYHEAFRTPIHVPRVPLSG